MMVILVCVSFVMMIFGFFKPLIINRKGFIYRLLACWVLILGVILLIGTIIFGELNSRVDIEKRTAIFTGEIQESHKVFRQDKGCIKVFTLLDTTFEVACSRFNTEQQPLPSDIVRVKFIRPNNEDDEIEVLEMENISNGSLK